MLSCCIDAIEDRKVVTVDVQADFLQSSWPKEKPTYLKFEGVMVEILLELDPSLSKNVINTKKGQKLMYGDLKKACYGTLLGSLLWFKKLTKKLED